MSNAVEFPQNKRALPKNGNITIQIYLLRRNLSKTEFISVPYLYPFIKNETIEIVLIQIELINNFQLCCGMFHLQDFFFECPCLNEINPPFEIL